MKIKDIEDKIPDHSVYITSNDFNRFSGTIFDERLKGPQLATSHDLYTAEKKCYQKRENQ